MDIKKMTLEEYRIWRKMVSEIGKARADEFWFCQTDTGPVRAAKISKNEIDKKLLTSFDRSVASSYSHKNPAIKITQQPKEEK